MTVREKDRQAKKYKRDWVDTDHSVIKKNVGYSYVYRTSPLSKIK